MFQTKRTDARESCKYGANCYQKNPDHRKKYRHPIKRKSSDEEDDLRPQKEKKPKTQITISNAVSDSEESDAEVKTEQELQPTNTQVLPLTQSLTDSKSFIKEKFLLEMPEDFYQFWDLAKTINADKPEYAFNSVGLTLVGPYDVLAAKFTGKSITDDDYLLHWRYYYDVPEFQTVIKGDDKTGHHIGYFRDEPSEKPVFLASNCCEKDGTFTIMGDNIFAAVYLHVEEKLKTVDPFSKAKLGKLHSQIKKKALELNLELVKVTKNIQARNKKIVSKTFNGIGLVVPYDKKTELGYRPLAMEDKQLKNVLNKLKNAGDEEKLKLKYLSELEPVLTFATIALDECDFGTAVELGWNLIFSDVDMNSTIARLLTSSYTLLNRPEFARIAEAHFANKTNRRTGCHLTVL